MPDHDDVYPIEIVEESSDSTMVKVHYVGYSLKFDEKRTSVTKIKSQMIQILIAWLQKSFPCVGSLLLWHQTVVGKTHLLLESVWYLTEQNLTPACDSVGYQKGVFLACNGIH